MAKPGRNDRCSCGSGRKYKRCCGMPPSPQPLSPAQSLGEGLGLLTLKDLEALSLSGLKRGFFPRHTYELSQDELDYLDLEEHPEFFEARRLASTGVLSLGVRFEVMGYDYDSNYRVSGDRLCQVVLQERAPGELLLGACDCESGAGRKPCVHLFATLLLLWGLLRREYPWAVDEEDASILRVTVEPLLDQAMGRASRPDPDAEVALTRVIFCPPLEAAAGVPGGVSDVGGASSGVVESMRLEAQKGGAREEISRGFTVGAFRRLPGLDENSVPRRLQVPPYSLTSWERGAPGGAEQKVLESLQYLFSNGQVLSMSELLHHRWIKKVPRELLPLRAASPEISSIPHWARLVRPQTEVWRRHADAELCEISRAALGVVARALGEGFPVFIALESRRSVPRLATRLTALETVLDPRTALCRLVPGALENEARLEPACDLGECLRIEGSRLWLLPGPALDRALPEVYRQHPVSGQERVREAVATVQATFANQGLPELGLPPEVDEVSSRTRPELWLEGGSGNFSFALGLPGLGARLWNFDEKSRAWLRVLHGGVGALVDGPNTELAHSRRGAKRDADLRILRHAGFAASVFYECACFALGGRASSGEAFVGVSEFRRWLKEREALLAGAIAGNAVGPTLPLEKLCSQRVAELVQRFANQVLEALSSPARRWTLVGGRSAWIGGSEAAFAKVARQLLAAEAARTGGQCFMKGRAAFGLAPPDAQAGRAAAVTSMFVERESETVNVNGGGIAIMEAPGALQAFLPLLSEGFEVYWNGKPVGLLRPEEIKTVFQLQETPSKGAGLGSGPLDWFELNPKVFLLGRELERGQLGELSRTGMIEHQGRLYLVNPAHLPSLKRLSRFWDRLRGGPTDETAGGPDSGGASYRRLPRSETLELLALERDLDAEVHGAPPEWRAVREFFRSLDEPRPALPLPATIRAELKPYQLAGVQWLRDLHRLKLGGVLADDMGLGKTLQALVFLEALRERGELGRCLVVVPTSLAWNWRAESERFTPALPMRIFEPKDKAELEERWEKSGAEVLVVTYGLLTEHSEWFGKDSNGGARAWDVVIFDEAQNLKNIRSKRSDAARRLAAGYKFCLTGTPLENHLGELYSILDLVVPGCLGELGDFQRRYESLPDVKQSVIELAFLRRVIRPLVLRRTKSQVLTELPPKTESLVKLPLERAQKKIYRDIALSWNRQVQDSIRDHGEARSQLVMLTALLRLRQVCSDPASVPGVKYSALPPKMELLAESVAEITDSGESVLVFTQFVSTLERLRAHLESLGMRVSVIHGAVSRAERERILRQFQDPAEPARILLMTLKTGGVGLNLTRASYVFHLEPWWNPAVENQATDRAHRLGQDRPVQVYRYLMSDTVEEKIEVLKARKSAVFEAVMTDSEAADEAGGTEAGSGPGLRTLNRGDFELLLKTSSD